MWLKVGIISILVLVLGPPVLYYLALWMAIWFGPKAAAAIAAIVAIFSIVCAGISIVILILKTATE